MSRKKTADKSKLKESSEAYHERLKKNKKEVSK